MEAYKRLVDQLNWGLELLSEAYFTVGVIANVHGLRGEVKVLSRTDFEDLRFRPKSHLFVRREGQAPVQEVVVRTARRHQQFWLVAFEGLSSINDVEHWKGMQLCVHESNLPALPEGTYYVHELVGLAVYSDTGEHLGELADVLTPGANDVYVVKSPSRRKDILLPAIPDCILNVDKPSRRMTVHILPGLLDEQEDE